MRPSRSKKLSPPTRRNDHLSPAKRRAFRIVTLLVPAAIVVVLEFSLRFFHYGPDLSLFTTENIGGRTCRIMNPDVKGRYFSRVDFRPTTSIDYFAVPKPPSTFRIFCLGGSTTIGYPYGYVGAFSTFLRDRLKVLFPERRVEIINLGMTATNSFTTADIMHELINYEPDLVLVYDGHNEFYGALGIASHESLGQTRWITQIYLRLVHFRSFLLLRDIYNGFRRVFSGPEGAELSGTMMERLARGKYIPYQGPEYMKALEMFSENLDDVADIARQHHVPVILASQVSNLRDLPPFVSQPGISITPERQMQYSIAFNRGLTEQMDGDSAGALAAFLEAARIDSSRADVHFEIARCLDHSRRFHEAEREYVAARDLDQLRFRTSSDFNTMISTKSDGHSIFFVDMERAFRANSPDSLIGHSLILEHLHPNARGDLLLAKAFAHTMQDHGLLAPREEWAARDTVSDEYYWEHRNLTDLDELCARRRTEILTSGWPFLPQDRQVLPVTPKDTLGTIAEEILQGKISWEQGHVQAIEFYRRRGDLERMEREYRSLINQVPLNPSAYLLLAQLYIQSGKLEPAKELLQSSLQIEKSYYATRMLGGIALQSGRPAEASTYLEQASALATGLEEQTETGYLLGSAYAQMGNKTLAVTRLQSVVKANPGFAPAKELLRRLGEAQP